MPLLAAMAVGAAIGAVAGFAVYAGKVLLTKDTRWSWRDAAAHTVGGVVGGGLFAPAMLGLAAIGVPATAAYVIAGGVAWGGVWALAQDAASWALGRAKGLGRPSHYLKATAIGAVATALLLPFASRVVGASGQLVPHSGTVAAFTAPPEASVAANLAKSEAEFLAFGVMSEGGAAMTRAVGRNVVRAGARRVVGEGEDHLLDAAAPHRTERDGATPATPSSPFGRFATRVHERVAPLPSPDLTVDSDHAGLVQRLAVGE